MVDLNLDDFKGVPVSNMTVQEFYRLIKQAVRDGQVEANQKIQTLAADRVRQLLNG